MAVVIAVDSTADLSADRARDLGISVIPLSVLFGDEAYRDGIDLDTATFYKKLTASTVTPTTSAPSPGLFEETYRQMIANGATAILDISLSSELSATYSAALQAAEEVTKQTGVPVKVVDSRTVSAGFGLPAAIVAQEARAGASLEQLTAHAESLLNRVHLYATLDTLEYLQRGGRIGKARAMLGTILSVKPLLEVRDGRVLPLEQVRTRSKALERLGQLVAQLGPLEALAVVASDPATSDLITAVARKFWQGDIFYGTLGPVVGTHAGPGAGGIIAITKA